MLLLAMLLSWEALGGVVVAIHGPEVVIDLGSERGLPAAARVMLFRSVEVRHPRTGKRIRDEFFLSQQDVSQVGTRLSILRPSPEVLKDLKVGDTVTFAPAPQADGADGPPDPVAAAAQSGAPAAPMPPTPPTAPVDSARLQKVRAEGFRAGLAAARADLAAGTGARAPAAARPEIGHRPPTTFFRATPAQLVFAVASPGELGAGWLYYRTQAGDDYRRVPLEPVGAGYLRARLPGEVLAADHVEYFAEASDPSGAPVPLHASARAPTVVPIEEADPTVAEARAAERSEIRLAYEYVDFNRLRGNDRYWITEADFLYRFGGRIYSLRMGGAAYDGVGGSVYGLDHLMEPPHHEGFNYGYAEIELRLAPSLSLLGKVLAGLTADGLGGGFEAKLRIGDERGTNLLFGGQVASHIGNLAMAKLTWDVIPRFPMAGTIEVTNQPVEEDLGVRMLLDLGWQANRWLRPTLTAGYAVRAVSHGGPTLGISQLFTW